MSEPVQMRAEKRKDPSGDLLDIDRAKMANRDMPPSTRWMWSVIGTLEDKKASDQDCLDELRNARLTGKISFGECGPILGGCVHDRPHIYKQMCQVIIET